MCLIIVRLRDETAEGKNSPKGLENPQVDSGSLQGSQEEAWAEVRWWKVREWRRGGEGDATDYWDGHINGLPAHWGSQDRLLFTPEASSSPSVEKLSQPQELGVEKRAGGLV